MSKFDSVRAHTRLLAYGTIDPSLASKSYAPFVGAPESGAASVLSGATATAAYQAMFGDACGFIATSTHVEAETQASFNVSACRLFAGGVMNNGFTAVVERWWAVGLVAADRSLRTLYNATPAALLAGAGFTLPAAAFNYSAVACRKADFCTPAKVTLPTEAPLAPTHLGDPTWAGDLKTAADFAALPNGTVPYSVAGALASAENAFLLAADELYLTPGLLALFNAYADEATRATTSYVVFLNVFTPCFMSAFVLIMFFWFLPQTVRENKAMQTKRAMLLYVPPPVLYRIRAMRELVAAIIAEDAAATMGTTAAAALGANGARVAPVRP